MNSDQLVPIQQGGGLADPSLVAKANSRFSSGVTSGGDFLPSLSLRGRQFRIKSGGTEVSLDNRTLDVILVTARETASKALYVGQFVPGEKKKPVCASDDGVRPNADIAQPQHSNCAQCPQNAWGSKVNPTTGAQGKACSDSKYLVLAPPQLDGDKPLMLILSSASFKNFDGYIKLLSANGLLADQVVTRLSFTESDAFPKLTFTYVRTLDATQAGKVAEIAERDDVQAVVNPVRLVGLTPLEPTPAQPTSTPPVVINNTAPIQSPPTQPAVLPQPPQPPQESPAPAQGDGQTSEVASLLAKWGATAKS